MGASWRIGYLRSRPAGDTPGMPSDPRIAWLLPAVSTRSRRLSRDPRKTRLRLRHIPGQVGWVLGRCSRPVERWGSAIDRTCHSGDRFTRLRDGWMQMIGRMGDLFHRYRRIAGVSGGCRTASPSPAPARGGSRGPGRVQRSLAANAARYGESDDRVHRQTVAEAARSIHDVLLWSAEEGLPAPRRSAR